MTFDSIFGFVLVLVVVGNAGLAWTIYATRRETRAQALRLATCAKNLVDLGSKSSNAIAKMREAQLALERQSPTTLGAQVAELSDAVERLRKTQQRFAGRFDRQMGHEREPEREYTAAQNKIDDDELAAMLRLQGNAPQ